MKIKEKLSLDIHIQKAFNKASTETIKLIELALENKLAFILFIPYVLWISFASYLNLFIVINN